MKILSPSARLYELALIACLLACFCTGAKDAQAATPVISNGLPTGTLTAGTSQITVTVQTNENAACRYTYTPGTAYNDPLYSHAFTTTGGTVHSNTFNFIEYTTRGQFFTYYVYCSDGSGNVNQTPYIVNFSVAAAAEPTLYPGSSPRTDLVSATGADLLLWTEGFVDCRYAATAGVAYGAMPGDFEDYGTFHRARLTGLTPSTTYTYYMRCIYPIGQPNTSDFPISFTTAASSAMATADTQPPTLTVFTVPATAASTTVSITALQATDNVAVAGYLLTETSTAPNAQTGNWTALAPTTYRFASAGAKTLYAWAKDAIGNVSAGLSALVSVLLPDTAPPILSNGSPAGSLGAATATTTLALTTNEAADCRYSTTANTAYAVMSGIFASTGSTTHSATVSGLASGQAYRYFIRCQDQASNANPTDFEITFSIAAPAASQNAGSSSSGSSSGGGGGGISVSSCSAWTYTDWSGCLNGTSTRQIKTATPAGCMGGSPLLTRSCVAETAAATTTAATSSTTVAITNSSPANQPGIAALSSDDDQDGLSNDLEIALGTSAQLKDSDGDGFDDSAELTKGFDPTAKARPQAIDDKFASRQAGNIFLQIENKGQAWYVYPDNRKRYFLGRPDDAFRVMRKLGLGTKHQTITRYRTYPDKLKGKILLDVEDKGKAYYINPKDAKAYYLGRPLDAFNLMRKLGIGISNDNLKKIGVGL
jgi:hypothetical protein